MTPNTDTVQFLGSTSDRNRNNVIDKDEAIDVIVLYINGTPLVTVAEQISDRDPLAGIDAYC